MTDGRSAHNSDTLRRPCCSTRRRTGRDVSEAIRRLLVCFAALVLVAAQASSAMGAAMFAPPAEELDVKAAFVLNFIRLVNWGNVSGEDNAATLPLCILGPSEFGTAVRQAAKGKVIGTRTVTFQVKPDADPGLCRVLLVDSTQYDLARSLIRAVGHSQVLTIGNGEGFVRIGGMFELIVDERKVQFDTNLAAVRASKLDVSARLLNLSRNLRRGGNGAD